MFVLKRNGKQERVQFDKISSRIWKLAYGLNRDFVDPAYITQKVIKGVYSGVTTSELDILAAETAAYLTTEHPDYSVLAARIAVSNLHKMTQKSFSAVMAACYECVDQSSGEQAQRVPCREHASYWLARLASYFACASFFVHCALVSCTRAFGCANRWPCCLLVELIRTG